MCKKHPTALVSSKSYIGDNVVIGPYTIIEEGVSIGNNSIIHSNVLIKSGTKIGNNCEFFSGAIIGEKPQDTKYKDEDTSLEIGNNCIVREYCTIHRGTLDRGLTKIGNNCLLMAYAHIAHDSFLGDNIILSNSVQVGGHVDIYDNVIVGGATPIHQFCKLGEYSFVGGGYRIVQDVPPYIKAMGEPLKYSGVNHIGLKRNNFSDNIVGKIKKAYRTIYRSEYNISQAIDILDDTFEEKEIKVIIKFIKDSKRGII